MGSWTLIPYQKAWSMLKKCGEKCKPESIMYQKKQKMRNKANLNIYKLGLTKGIKRTYNDFHKIKC